MLLATVKGDVHDIGKNIVSVVLGCNNYEIIDLGVMVPCNKILDEAVKNKVDVIGLSGLITPSLDEMVYVAKEMQNRNMKIPLVSGGATTSKVHTAVKINHHYESPVIHILDASKSVGVISSLFSKEKVEFCNELDSDYQKIKKNYLERKNQKKFISLDEARANKLKTNWKEYNIPVPNFTCVKVFKIKIEDIINYIDWTPFFYTWEMKQKYPQIFEDEKYGVQAQKLFNDANEILKKIIDNDWIELKSVIGIWSACSDGDDILLKNSDNSHLETFCMLRQQTLKAKNNLSLSDYIAPKESGKNDYVGAFVCSADLYKGTPLVNFELDQDDYSTIMFKSISDRLAEALTEYMHEKVRKELWAYSSDENYSNSDLIDEAYTGIRPAPGYTACPDHTEKLKIFKILNAKKNIGASLTESMAMSPSSTVSGYYFSHPNSKYFPVGKIQDDQIEDYAKRKNMTIKEVRKWLLSNI